MSQNRSGRQLNESGTQPASTPVVVEVLRNAAESAKAGEEAGKDKEEKSIPLFWRVFGGTVLSMVSLVVMTAYSGFNASLAETKGNLASLGTEVRKETARLEETMAGLSRKEELATTMSSINRNLTELGEDHKAMAGLRVRCAELVSAFKTGEKERRVLEGELQKLREEQAADAERRALVEDLGRLRERLASMEGRTAVK